MPGQIEKLLEIYVLLCSKISWSLSAGQFHGFMCTVLIRFGVS